MAALQLHLRFCRSVDKVCNLHTLLVVGVVFFFIHGMRFCAMFASCREKCFLSVGEGMVA